MNKVRKGDTYSTYQSDCELHKMILVGVSMEEKAMGRNVSSRHTPFVTVAKCLTIRLQNHIPITVVIKG